MKFVALDVETANADLASICQIGLAHYDDCCLVEEWKSYVDPQDFFDAVNVSIHGIGESMVKGAPNFEDVAGQLYKHMDNNICVCHTHFDRVAMRQAFERVQKRHPSCIWLDSARVARRAWAEFALRGYGLQNICDHLDYSYAAHDALEDAKAAAHVLIAAMGQTGLDIQDWLKRVEQPINLSKSRQT